MELILLIIVWIPLCLIVGAAGINRRIGFIASFLIALIFSPLIGFICVALSERKKVYYQQEKDNDENGFDIDRYRVN